MFGNDYISRQVRGAFWPLKKWPRQNFRPAEFAPRSAEEERIYQESMEKARDAGAIERMPVEDVAQLAPTRSDWQRRRELEVGFDDQVVVESDFESSSSDEDQIDWEKDSPKERQQKRNAREARLARRRAKLEAEYADGEASLRAAETAAQQMAARPSRKRRRVGDDDERVYAASIGLDVGEARRPPFVSSTLMVVKKATTEKRVCWNGVAVNKFIPTMHFKMESIATLRQMMLPGDFACTLDFKSAYWSILVREDLRRLLNFEWNGEFWRWRSLCFGLSLSPRIFTKIIKPAITKLREAGIRICVYLDDMVILGRSAAEAQAALVTALDMFKRLGLHMSQNKCMFIPSQCFDFLGFRFDTVEGMCMLQPEKQEKYRQLCAAAVARAKAGGTFTQREISSLLGKLNSCAAAIQGVRMFVFRTLQDLREQYDRNDWESRITLSATAIEELTVWCAILECWDGASLWHPTASEEIGTDASGSDGAAVGAWCAATHSHPRIECTWTVDGVLKTLSSNARELVGSCWAIMKFAKELDWRDISVIVHTDNIVGMYYLTRLGGRIPILNELMRPCVELLRERNIHVIPRYIPGPENVCADTLSRLPRTSWDAPLDGAVFKAVEAYFCTNRLEPPFSVDLFAEHGTTKVERYVAARPDVASIAVDAFRLRWDQPLSVDAPTTETIYAFPPPSAIGRVVAQVRDQHAELVLVAPAWPSAAWWPMLLRLATEMPLLLPERAFPWRQHGEETSWPTSPTLAWRLSGRRLASEASTTTAWPPSWLESGEMVQVSSTIRDGHDSPRFVTTATLTCLRRAARTS